MADPILDEETIILLLKCPINAENVTRIQTAAVQAMIDLYDRKVTRDEFAAGLSSCIALYGQTAKLWLLANVEGVHREGGLDQERFDKAREGLEEIIRKQCETVIEIVKRLKMCPTSEDKLH